MTTTRLARPDRMLTPSQVASLFGVNTKTVRRWAAAGELPFIFTRGGHRRYPEQQIRALLQDGTHNLINPPVR